jgi:uncharacterized protein (DUF1800 family)
LSRAAFGPSFKDLSGYEQMTYEELAKQLFRSSAKYTPLEVTSRREAMIQNPSALTPEQKKEFRKQQREILLDLNTAWIEKMCTTDAVLREKMTLFWHDHFACSTKNPYFAQDLNNILRKNALGRFDKMLTAVSKSPAMLQYLNNQQNRAASPNENFAREVMELFTLGRGHYTENDIKNAARAFTGWGFNREGEFIFRNRQHDYGKKEFMGYKGNFGGEDILNILLENKQTAVYLTEKLYRYFINEQIEPELHNILAERFYSSGYNIGRLMYDIFTSKEFYEDQNMNRLIKSPVELIVSYGRLLPVRQYEKKALLRMQRALGQVLFIPPNVGGWPYGKEWINSTSIVYRMQLPYTMLNLQKNKKRNKKMTLDVDWKLFYDKTRDLDKDTLAVLLIGKVPDGKEKDIINNSVEKFTYPPVRNAIQAVSWLCLPEYQLA